MNNKAKRAAKRAHRAERKLSHPAKGRPSAPVRAAGKVAEIADQPPLIALTSLTLATGLLMGRGRLARAGARMLASHLLATAVKTAIKHRIDRTRPEAAARGMRYRLEEGGDHGHDLASFPSGHTAGAVAVTRALARDYPESTPYGLVASASVAAIQLPNAKHYASDVAVGAIIGVASEWLVSAAFDNADRAVASIRRPQPSARRPDRSAPR